MRLPEGYKVIIEDKEGNILGEVDIGEYDLDKHVARSVLINEIQEIAERKME